MKRLILLLCGTLFLYQICLAQISYKFRHYSVEDGLSQNTVMAIMQDHKGFMWFGTWDGLNKFDGYQFTTYKSHPGDDSQITTNRIDFIYEDQLGYIWFQTYDGSFHRFDPKKETFFSLPNQTERFTYNVQRTDCFLETNPGEIWIATQNGGVVRSIPKTDAEKPEIVEYNTHSAAHQLCDDHVFFLSKDKLNNVWIGTNCGLYCVVPDGNMRFYHPNPIESENKFYSICQTETGLWFGAGDGVVWRYSDSDMHFERVSLGVNTIVTDIALLEKRYMIATTSDAGFFIYDTQIGKLTRYCAANTSSIKSDEFISISVDSYGIAWLESMQPGIFRYRIKDASLKHFQPKVDAVHSYSLLPNHIFFEDVNQRLWLNPQGGGFSWYNRDEDCLEYFFNEPDAPDCSFSNVIHTAFADKDGNLWLSTYNKGLDQVVSYTSQFQLYKPDNKFNTLTSNEVRSIGETSDGYLFVSTKDGRVRCYDNAMGDIGLLCTDGTIADKGYYLSDMVYCMYEDMHKRLWLGTKGGGLILLTPHYKQGERPRYYVKRFYNSINNPYSLSNDNIYSIIEAADGTIMIGTFGGGLNIVQEKNGIFKFVHAGNDLTEYPIDKCAKIRDMQYDNDSVLWIGTANGLLQVEKQKNGKYKTYYCKKISKQHNSLSNNDVHCLHVDKNGQLWLGTFGGGINKVLRKATDSKDAEFMAYTMVDGLYNDIVLCILEDNLGNLWLSSENAISRFDTQSNTFQNFNVLSGSSNAYFSESTGIYHSSGKIMFGSNKGFFAFDPERILRSDDVPTIEFTHFQLFNKDVEIGGRNSSLQQSIGETKTITLTHAQSVFSLEYAALDFDNPEKIQYAFMLENFDNSWNYVHNQRKATYTNLPKGVYYFKVKSTNKEGVWVNNEKTMVIMVKPSFWETPVAYCLYGLLVIIVLLMVYYLASTYNKLKTEIQVEQKVTDIKLRFFTNISHELRTPLSLILGPVENILHNEKITPTVREQLQVVLSNTSRMLRMINQILDFRKLQNKKLRLKIQPTKFETLVHETCANFNKEAFGKNIGFHVVNNAGEVVLWVDRDKTDMILYNLLSNSFKFTPSGKNITVQIDQKNGFVLLKVIDEGVGIPRDKRGVLFERFSSANEIQSLSNTRGSGIGLNLVKELVDLHKGYIEVESEPGKGTTFTVMFREGKEHYDNDVDFVVDDIGQQEMLQSADSAQMGEHLETMAAKDALLMLIVEDNADMRIFLSNIFKHTYRIVLAEDGVQGVDIAKNDIPDLIITDLMMPNMDGLQLTNILKSDEATSHIPIVLLTAKSAVESRLDALKFGADDYITKPFSPVYLEARVENILEQRRRLQERYRKELLELQPKKLEHISPEETFLAKLLDFMERNMDNNELVIDDLVSEMALGRTVFFNKLKSLTGLSPVEFVREVRVKRAAQLLESGKYNVTEITYMVGMNDSRYFSKCFKAVYGMTPTEYKKSL